METQFASAIEHSEQKNSLEELRRDDSHLRDELESDFPDDARYYSLLDQYADYIDKARSAHTEGIDKSHFLAAAAKVMEELEKTQRYQASTRFEKISEKRIRTEEADHHLHSN